MEMRCVMQLKSSPFRLVAVPVLSDNFVYLVCRGQDAVLIDAGAAGPVEEILRAEGLLLREILLTHRHADHTAGLPALERFVQPGGQLPGPVETLSLPGHTPDDRGYYFSSLGVVFTGDCLINGGCGRAISGSVPDLYRSLQRLLTLPPDTLICGGHDYLLENLRFAAEQDPGNEAIRQRRDLYQADPKMAIFQSIADEIRTNPFLTADNARSFAALRADKDLF